MAAICASVRSVGMLKVSAPSRSIRRIEVGLAEAIMTLILNCMSAGSTLAWHIFQAVDQLILPSQARSDRLAAAGNRHRPDVPPSMGSGEEADFHTSLPCQTPHLPDLIVREHHHAASLRNTVDGDLIAVSLLDNRRQRVRAFCTGNFYAILSSVGKSFCAAGQAVQIARGQAHCLEETSRGLHQERSPFMYVKRRPCAGI